jgi:hypothetical protein
MVGNLLVALVLITGEFDVQASAIVESRVGEAPVVAGNVPQAFVAEIVTPAAALEYRDPALSFRVSYAPRIYWAHPNALNTEEPLLLHTAELVLKAQTTRRFVLQASVTGAIGNPDYTQLAPLVGVLQGTLPTVTKIASVTGRIGAHALLTRRWELDLDGQIFYWESLGTPANVPTPNITEQTSGAEQATALFRLSPRYALGFGVAGNEAAYGTGVDVTTIGPTISWRAQLTPRDELRLILGLAYVRASGPTLPGMLPLLGPSGQTVSPVGGFALVSRVARRDEVLILANASGGVDYYLDPIIGTAAPRARADAGIVAIMLPSWLASLHFDFATALRGTPLPPISGVIPDETVFSLTLAVRRRISLGFFAEVGATWAERAPAFVTPDFQFHQRQIWVYAQLSWTSHPLPHQLQ